MTFPPKLGMSESIKFWHFKTLTRVIVGVGESLQIIMLGETSRILKRYTKKYQKYNIHTLKILKM